MKKEGEAMIEDETMGETETDVTMTMASAFNAAVDLLEDADREKRVRVLESLIFVGYEAGFQMAVAMIQAAAALPRNVEGAPLLHG